ncbi:hypothetical protein BLA29_012737, partial [Euroglyphus maynei]
MHPDNDNHHDVHCIDEHQSDDYVEHQSASIIMTIPVNWLQTYQWNREQCLQWKQMIENDLKQLEKFRSNNEFNEIIKQRIRFLENKLVRNFVRLIFARKHWPKWEEIDDLHSFSIVSNWFQAIGLDNKCKE